MRVVDDRMVIVILKGTINCTEVRNDGQDEQAGKKNPGQSQPGLCALTLYEVS